jgi:hypothetical protein
MFGQKKPAPKQDAPTPRGYAHHMADRMNAAYSRIPKGVNRMTPEQKKIWWEALDNGVTLKVNMRTALSGGPMWEPEGAHEDYVQQSEHGPFIDPFTGEWYS